MVHGWSLSGEQNFDRRAELGLEPRKARKNTKILSAEHQKEQGLLIPCLQLDSSWCRLGCELESDQGFTFSKSECEEFFKLEVNDEGTGMNVESINFSYNWSQPQFLYVRLSALKTEGHLT